MEIGANIDVRMDISFHSLSLTVDKKEVTVMDARISALKYRENKRQHKKDRSKSCSFQIHLEKVEEEERQVEREKTTAPFHTVDILPHFLSLFLWL